MAYVKIIYQNSPSTATPINAENLNHMDDQIALNDQRLTEIETSYVKSFNGRKGEVTPQAGDYDISQIAPTSGATVGQIPIIRNDGTAEDPEYVFHMEDVPSSGHVIEDSAGTPMTQRANMKFSDAHVTDDSENGSTDIEIVKEVTQAQLEALGSNADGRYFVNDGEDAEISPASDEYVSVTASGDTWRSLLAKLRSASGFDFDKITRDSLLLVDNTIYRVVGLTSTVADFSFDSAHLYSMIATMNLYKTGDSYRFDWTNTGGSAETSTYSVPDGTKLTLYYGNKSAVIDLQTTANRCLMSNGETVQSEVSKVDDRTNSSYHTKVTLASGSTVDKSGLLIAKLDWSAQAWSYVKLTINLCIIFEVTAGGTQSANNVIYLPIRLNKGDTVDSAVSNGGAVTLEFIPTY